MAELVSLSRDGDIGIVLVNNPPVNALSPGVPEGIMAAVRAAEADDSIKVLVLIGAGRTFIAGADIREFEKIICGRRDRGVGLHPLLYALEDCAKPVICAIHGTALGGGLEVAMACHYRMAVPAAQVGQPEVKLGLIPGAGGTQRLPRLAGVRRALEMCTHGEPVRAPHAFEWGIIDRLAEGELLAAASGFARELAATPPRKTRELDGKLGQDQANALLFAAAREEVRKRYRGRIAPLKAIDAIEAATKLGFQAGCDREAELFMECLFSEQARALIHVFFGEREVVKVPGVPKGSAAAEIRKAAVVGAGTMGAGIAMTFANAGVPVLVKDVSPEALDRGMEQVRTSYQETATKGKISADESSRRLSLIKPVADYSDFGEVDAVVEAAFESLEVKKKVFAELDSACGPSAILATNTSSLDIDQIASATSRPQNVVGLHFFAPPQVMRLVEIVRGKSTAPRVIASAMALARTVGKSGVVVGNCHGFVGNRMYHQYQREAQFLVEEGAGVPQVDAALYNFGMAMGPFAAADLSGLDVGWRIRKEHAVRTEGRRQYMIADRLCELGRFGRKTGAGWYRYEPGNRTPVPDPDVDRIVAECVRNARIPQREVTAAEIVERTVYALINEGARVLEEGIALRAVDIDIIYVYGYGFPAHRGGPMCFADTVGLPKIHARTVEFEREFGPHWTPAPLLARLAAAGSSFAEYDARGASAGDSSGA